MTTDPTPSALHDRIRAAWHAARAIGFIGPAYADFAAAIDYEAGDGKPLLIRAPVGKWFNGSVVPSFRTMMGIAKVAGYDRRKTKRLLFGPSAGRYVMTEKDWMRFVDRGVKKR